MKISASFVEAVQSGDKVAGYTHQFYRYPARFSPQFARAAIAEFSDPGDVILDPFVGGGTTLVEASLLGRKSIGVDISGLATFISRVKTTPFSPAQLNFVLEWQKNITNWGVQTLKIRPEFWIERGYQTNLNDRDTWRIRKFIEVILFKIEEIRDKQISNFLRCCVLKTGQWALDGRKEIPSLDGFRDQFLTYIEEMLAGISSYSSEIRKHQEKGYFWDGGVTAKIYTDSVVNINFNKAVMRNPAKLILTSPPYPGIHVLYHRWQVKGRRETPAPFWIADHLDGNGSAYYTFGSRKQKEHVDYFSQIEQTFQALKTIARNGATIVQLVGFEKGKRYLNQYLEIMRSLGYVEVTRIEKGRKERIVRKVPNRKWHARFDKNSSGSLEYLLVHRI